MSSRNGKSRECKKASLALGSGRATALGRLVGNKFVFTGGPGAGKTTVLDALESCGRYCVPDVARAIIRARLDSGLAPRPEPAKFASGIFDTDVANYQMAPSREVCFFDRGVVDSLAMMQSCGLVSDKDISGILTKYPYNKVVFLFPIKFRQYRQGVSPNESPSLKIRLPWRLRPSRNHA